MALTAEQRRLARKYGRLVDGLARKKYGISGPALVAKLIQGESGGRQSAVSSAGARGITQFMPGTRKAVKDKYGVDPYRSEREAVHAATLHLRGKLGHRKGLEGYNPGGGRSYVDYILGQKVGDLKAGRGGSSAGEAADKPRYRTETTTTPGVDRSQDRKRLLAEYLLSDQRYKPGGILELKAGMDAMQDTPAKSTTRRVKVKGARAASRSSGGGGTPGRSIRGKSQRIGVPYQGTHTLGNWQSDNAVDLRAKEGSVVQLPRGGVVEKVKGSYKGGKSRFDGYQVTVRLDDGRRVFLTHLSRTHVRPGQRIKAGQAVGRVGSANGVPHLHAAVERGDPRKLFR